jgi:hypothetical protein
LYAQFFDTVCPVAFDVAFAGTVPPQTSATHIFDCSTYPLLQAVTVQDPHEEPPQVCCPLPFDMVQLRVFETQDTPESSVWYPVLQEYVQLVVEGVVE